MLDDNLYAHLKITFGKYKGQMMIDVDDSYLFWIVNHFDNKHWKEAAERTLRFKSHCREQQKKYHQASQSSIDVNSWYRQMSAMFHPDRRGGSCEGMKAVQAGRDLLQKMIGY